MTDRSSTLSHFGGRWGQSSDRDSQDNHLATFVPFIVRWIVWLCASYRGLRMGCAPGMRRHMSSIDPRNPVRTRRNDDPWVSIAAAARALGVSTSTLRVWASEGSVPHVRTAGGHRRFNPEGLREWMAERPSATPQSTRRSNPRLTASAAAGASVRASSDAVIASIERYLDGQSLSEYRRLAENEQRGTILAWLDVLADALESGRLAAALEQSGAYGRAHGLARSSAELALTGSLALERALDAALEERSVPLSERRLVSATLGTLTIRVATSWAQASYPEP